MLPAQQAAMSVNDGTIIVCSPVLTPCQGEAMRVVLRDLGRIYAVTIQFFPIAGDPRYGAQFCFPKQDEQALQRAWDDFTDRSRRLLFGEPCRLDKYQARTAATTLGTFTGMTPRHTLIP